MSKIVYKIVTKVNWNNFILSGAKECKGFDNDIKDGFIHLSSHKDLYSTFICKYKSESVKNTCKLIAVDLDLSNNVKWEKGKNGILYPHLYSSLVLNKNIIWVIDLENYQFNVNGI